jgi:acyl carrier protein
LAVVGPDWLGLAGEVDAAGADVRSYADVAELTAAVAGGDPVPAAVLACAGTQDLSAADEDVPGAARAAVAGVLGLVQDWLAENGLGSVPLVIVTRGAVAAGPGEGVTDLAGAAVRGLARSVQAEDPGRLVLADLPLAVGVGGGEAGLLVKALGTGEPELVIRSGVVYGRRLARPAAVDSGPADASELCPAGTMLVTGGTGMLGGLVARHLATSRRAQHLVLTSRSGAAAPGAPGLAAGLALGGVAVTVTACDVGDRGALAGLLAAVPEDQPLRSVIHLAGVTDDGVTGSLTPARVDAVMRPKADAAWHLHELTAEAELDEFVMFSSAAATFGAPGQGNYAAANAFMDGLAAARRAAGLPGLSLAWGLWAGDSALTGHLGEEGRARISRSGMRSLTAAEGLALLDVATGRNEAVLVGARLDVAAWRARAARGEDVPVLWHGLSGAPAQRAATAAAAAGEALRARLAALPSPADRDRLLTGLVCTNAAAVLGHASPDAIDPARPFTDIGFDSLTAIELRNRLTEASGLQLPATLIFDYPAPAVLAAYLREELVPDTGGQADSEEDKLRNALASVPLSRFRDAGLLEAMLRLADLNGDMAESSMSENAEAIDTLDAESLIRMALGNDGTEF